MPSVCYIGLGANLGDRAASIDSALARIAALPRTRLTRVGGPIETAPVGDPDQPAYLNAVAEVLTSLAPRDLLAALLAVERALGRVRDPQRRWGPRTIDLDLLVFGSAVVEEPGLIVPHPRMAERRFVLAPLAGLAPALPVPGTGRTVAELLAALPPGG
jgi:2-amino-4-hydroxy-6-hydroxymethyldihydropteridine diphosphokinase